MRVLSVLVACEFSATVREAFRELGHDAWSCDLLPTEGDPQWHYQEDVINVLHRQQWNLLIAHPPCTHLAVSGARWFKDKVEEQKQAIKFVEALWDAPVPRICIENPVSVLSTRSRLGKPSQVVQPWMFGHGETKATCLWLRGLPKLVPTQVVEGREPKVHYASPGPDRWKVRSRTYRGIAQAMASQWGAQP